MLLKFTHSLGRALLSRGHFWLCDLPPVNRTSTRRVIPLLRSFTVFNAAQVEGLPEELTAPSEPPDG